MTQKIIGIIPAAGRGTRLGVLPCSKEILPLGFRSDELSGSPPGQIKVVSHYLLEHLAADGIDEAIFVVGSNKVDIANYYRRLSALPLTVSFCTIDNSPGTPFSVNAAYHRLRGGITALGYPDILFNADHAYRKILRHLDATGSDVMLGLFPARDPSAADMVELTADGEVLHIQVKPESTQLRLTWGIAVWNSRYTEFQFQHLGGDRCSADHLATLLAQAQRNEIYMSDVILAGMAVGIKVRAMQVSDEPFLDIGTPANLKLAISQCLGVPGAARGACS